MKKNTYILGVVLFFISGCFKSDPALDAIQGNVLDFEPRVTDVVGSTNVLLISDMDDDDIIVSVNGFPLRKKAYEDMMALRLDGLLKQRGASQIVIEKQMESFRREYVDMFVGQRLLIDNALQLKVVTTNEVLSFVKENISENAKKRGKTVEDIFRQLKNNAKYYFYELAASYVMNKLIKEKIPPTHEVDDKFVSLVQKQVEADNNAANMTNQMLKAKMSGWRDQIVSKGIDFGKVSDMLSTRENFTVEIGEQGYWGIFERGDMDEVNIEDAVFALKEGEVSEVLEGENGYHLVKVLKVIPEERDEGKRLIANERRELALIYIEKLPLFIRQNDVQMTADLKNQMQLNAINRYTYNLMTNNLNTVVYPHGRKLH